MRIDPDPDNGRYDTEQPWICWWFLTHDLWWPPWRSTRVLGRSLVLIECSICGKSERLTLRMPRLGPVPIPKGGKHPERVRFMLAHLHPDKPHPMAWAKPLRNIAAHPGGLDLDLLKMRLEADLRAES